MNAYASTEETTRFNKSIRKAAMVVTQYAMLIIIGDLNAIGKEQAFKEIAGWNSHYETTNNNSHQSCYLATANNLKVRNTCPVIKFITVPRGYQEAMTVNCPYICHKYCDFDHFLIR